jgi:hypothetical protein
VLRAANILSVRNLMARSAGARLKGEVIKALSVEAVHNVVPEADVARAMGASVAVIQCLEEQIRGLEKTVLGRVKLREEFRLLKTTPGIGDILSLTIMLEAGEIGRFPSVGDWCDDERQGLAEARLRRKRHVMAGYVERGQVPSRLLDIGDHIMSVQLNHTIVWCSDKERITRARIELRSTAPRRTTFWR